MGAEGFFGRCQLTVFYRESGSSAATILTALLVNVDYEADSEVRGHFENFFFVPSPLLTAVFF